MNVISCMIKRKEVNPHLILKYLFYVCLPFLLHDLVAIEHTSVSKLEDAQKIGNKYNTNKNSLYLLPKVVIDKEQVTILQLRFQHQQSDFLVFYDSLGEPLFLKFRKDKFDYSRDSLLKEIVQGGFYEVSFKYWGVLEEQSPPIKKLVLPLVVPSQSFIHVLPKKKPVQRDQTKVGEFIKLKYIILDTIEY